MAPVDNVLFGDIVDYLENFLRSESATSGDQLSSNIFCRGGSAVQRKQKRTLELRLGNLDLFFREVAVSQPAPFSQNTVNHWVACLGLVHNNVGSPQTRIGVGGGERHERVAQRLLVASSNCFSQWRRRNVGGSIPVSNNRLCNQSFEIVVRRPRAAFHADGKVCVWQRLVTNLDLVTIELWNGSTRSSQRKGSL
ncbi:hypothetical protein OGAPHI_004495 [Ogataea philodendri]|uniref:Uncharacterized protein n=1 Tax=Ogataea philodendri TaxID=1378263 RepID=A0A9P8T5U8_9ASCO|nr:uncharacterized protein OGAPHI_004495 [Ogataea philodendri]KAH3666306.1 hypothetical protein OGAPHI_004495 [Ogataea philodendri]